MSHPVEASPPEWERKKGGMEFAKHPPPKETKISEENKKVRMHHASKIVVLCQFLPFSGGEIACLLSLAIDRAIYSHPQINNSHLRQQPILDVIEIGPILAVVRMHRSLRRS